MRCALLLLHSPTATADPRQELAAGVCPSGVGGLCLPLPLRRLYPEWKIADPICSFVFGAIVLATTPGILKQGFKILLNAAPSNMSKKVYTKLYKVDCIEDVHDLHLWPLNASGKLALTVHIVATDKAKALRAAQDIAMEFNIRHTTIQVEQGSEEIENCEKVNSFKCVMEEENEIKLLYRGYAESHHNKMRCLSNS